MSARILVVDDVPVNLRLLEAKLSAEYYQVLTASNGVAALEIARTEKPDLILLDVMMPEMDGFEVCRHLKADPAVAYIPVVMVTALSDHNDRMEGFNAGADDFLTKPVNDVALFARVRSLLRLKSLMDEWRMREETAGILGMSSGPADTGIEIGNANILLVEDDELDAGTVREALQSVGHDVTIVNNTKEGQERAGTGEFDLVLISLTLASEDGLRLCSLLRSNEATRHLPVVIMVVQGDMEHLAKGLDIGANDYIIKPVDGPEIAARARSQIRRKRYQDSLRQSLEQRLSMAVRDGLTGLYNRRYFDAHLATEMQRCRASGQPMAMTIIDVDRFKPINDTHGHAVGDEVLREVARRIADNVRTIDLCVRYGGEEFVVMMPQTDLNGARTVAERIRARIADLPIKAQIPGALLTVTASFGIALCGAEDDGETFLKRADAALYRAKNEGRNRVIADGDPATQNLASGA